MLKRKWQLELFQIENGDNFFCNMVLQRFLFGVGEKPKDNWICYWKVKMYSAADFLKSSNIGISTKNFYLLAIHFF